MILKGTGTGRLQLNAVELISFTKGDSVARETYAAVDAAGVNNVQRRIPFVSVSEATF